MNHLLSKNSKKFKNDVNGFSISLFAGECGTVCMQHCNATLTSGCKNGCTGECGNGCERGCSVNCGQGAKWN